MGGGSCFCGKLHYEISGDPVMKATCHCLTCRKSSGSTNTTNICMPADKYRLTSGTPRKYNWTHESGMKMEYSFCGDCGVTLSKTADGEAFKDLIIVQAGTLDDEDGIENAAPAAELYVKNRVSWIPALAGAGQMKEFS